VAKKAIITVNPLFKLLLIINTTLSVVSLAIMVALAFFAPDPLTKAQDQLLNACETVFKMTAGTFIGLLGGRAAAPDPVGQATGSPPPSTTFAS